MNSRGSLRRIVSINEGNEYQPVDISRTSRKRKYDTPNNNLVAEVSGDEYSQHDNGDDEAVSEDDNSQPEDSQRTSEGVGEHKDNEVRPVITTNDSVNIITPIPISINYIEKYIGYRIDYSYSRVEDRIITSMNRVINKMINEFFTHISDYENIYISYLYNPLENMFISLLYEYVHGNVRDYDDNELQSKLDGLNGKLEELFLPILHKHKRNIQQIIRENLDDLLINAFNLLYTELNSLLYIRKVILQAEQDDYKFQTDLQNAKGFVSLYLSTIPLFLFILILEYFERPITLAELQSFSDEYNSYYDKYKEGRTIVPPETGQPLTNQHKLDDIVRKHNMQSYLEILKPDVLRINEIPDVDFKSLLDSYTDDIRYNKDVIMSIITRAIDNPDDMSNPDDTPANTTTIEVMLYNTPSSDNTPCDIPSSEVMSDHTISSEDFNEKRIGEYIVNPADIDSSNESSIEVDDNGFGDNASNIGVVFDNENIGGSQAKKVKQLGGGGEKKLKMDEFGNFTTVLGRIHDIITEPFTSSCDGLLPMKICDNFVDYSSGNFSGKKIVLDWLGLFMSLVISLIINDPENTGKIPDNFKAHFLYDDITVYPQEFTGGDLIMAGYYPLWLYNADMKLNSMTEDINKDIKLYCAGSPDTDDATVIPATYNELFGEFPESINSNDLNRGWASKSYSSLMGLITLAFTLDNNTTRGAIKEYITLNTSYPTKIRESYISKLTKKQKVSFNYNTIVEKIKQLKDGLYLGEKGKKYVQTFFDLRTQAIALILEHENGGLRVKGAKDTSTDINYTSLDPSFKLLLYNPELHSFEYEYIYAYVYKNILAGELDTIKTHRSISFIDNIKMVKGIIKGKTNPFKEGGWSDLYKAAIITAYDRFAPSPSMTSSSETADMTLNKLLPSTPIEGDDSTDTNMNLGVEVRLFNDQHKSIIDLFLTPDADKNIFEIKYNDETITRGVQINTESISVSVTDFLEKYAVNTKFHNCFTSRAINSSGTLDDTNIHENYCNIQEEQHITLKRLIYQFFPQDMCHDATSERTSMDISKYVKQLANNSFAHIGVDSYEKIMSNSKIIEPKNIAKNTGRTYEQETASMMINEQQYTKSVYFGGNITKLDKNNIGLTPDKSLEIRNSTDAFTFNNAVCGGAENAGNSATFIDGGTKKILENIILPNLCISLTEDTVISGVSYTITLYVIVSYTIDSSGDNTPNLIMNVSLYYIKTQLEGGVITHIFVNHEFILGKGISCSDIYRDTYNKITKLTPTGVLPNNKTRSDIITNTVFDPALAVFVLLKKTLCDWLQNFLKIKVNTKPFPRLGFFVKIKEEIVIPATAESIHTATAKFVDTTVDTTNNIEYGGGTISGIQNVLNALNKGVYRNNKYYIYIHSPDPAHPYLYVPINNSIPLLEFSDYNKPIDIITPSYVRNDICEFPRFQLFSYINIFWINFSPSFSPNNYRYFNTLPLLTLNPENHKPIFCITGDILDFCFSLILTFITFNTEPTTLGDENIDLSSFVGDVSSSSIRYNDIPLAEEPSIVILNKNTVMTGGMKNNSNYRRKKKISYSNTKRKSTKKRKSSKKRKSKKVYKQNKMKSKITKKNIRNNTKKR